MRRVYLRARGGTLNKLIRQISRQGLSPRTRRNRNYRGTGCRSNGSISAHAEEPGVTPSGGLVERVYLRARGGTSYL
ncbi:Hypothetical protein GbCGDNIH1_1700 [Granulibacter bethesdensis CGDNIH1]|uniref:Uncharacterized protein n=1 Tax=Granulibacter bethesdensis (strain ATCC BAA-1260 / CGDNIH1) TaxID=391165 RepID=Q0BRF4_GRABC|nr:Hypothetical protein GbCGDNIH1_1700 [Granulibacter bethesdensis CGDNIH1]APH65140.1 Hypothetical protein GbCGDNIH1I4_1700 [Granulibacter bethesdensis]